MTRSLLYVGALLAGYAVGMSGRSEPVYQGEFVIAMEPSYGAKADGIQFFALQRIESREIDRATCSVDADLPLAGAMRTATGARVRLTLERLEPRALLELKR